MVAVPETHRDRSDISASSPTSTRPPHPPTTHAEERKKAILPEQPQGEQINTLHWYGKADVKKNDTYATASPTLTLSKMRLSKEIYTIKSCY